MNMDYLFEKTQQLVNKQNNVPLNIGVTGESGSGKSTFVNAFRGITNSDEGAAPTGVVETTSEVTPYPHPNYPNVTLWDLPGIGTTRFPADKYLKLVGFEKFDFFIIISDTRFRENDVKLAQEIQKMGKKFYFVRSKIDNDVQSEKRSQKEFNEEKTLTQIRDNCIKGLQKQGVETSQVFLVSSFDLHLYDFHLLQETLERELPEHKRINMEDLFHSCPEMEEIKEDLQNNRLDSAAEKIQEFLNKQNNVPLNIGVTGECGSGKSTFVNAFRGITNNEVGAAPTGVVETTMEVTPYPHPNYPNVTLWDLPGIGTTHFPADKYLKRVGFEKFDFFIIISDTRFRENDVKLAQEIQKMGKKFYFVRSKIDNNLRDEERSQREFNEERTLKQIRENCIKGLHKQGFEAPQVFLVSSFDFHLYDFHLLEETLERELPELKRNALLLAMPSVSLEIINKKKKALKSKIKLYAILSAGVGAVPVPGISLAVDIAMIVGVVTQYVFAFGLDIPSLKRLAQTTGVPYEDLMAVILSPLAAKKITTDLIVKVVQSLGITAVLIAAEEVSRFIPILGIPAAMSLSFASTYRILSTFLDMLADDAERVFKKALGLNTSV